MAAEVLANGGAQVTVYDRMPSAGRKFLMAGRGGLNLTHSEELSAFLARYGDAQRTHCAAPSRRFRRTRCARGAASWDSPTYVGSSGRVFPVAMKASPLLRAWLRRLDAAGVRFALRHEWTGWDDAQRLTFDTPDGAATVEADATVLALGGASWPRLGSDGGWTDVLDRAGVRGLAAQAVQLRISRRLVGASSSVLPGSRLKRIAAVVRRSLHARRGDHHRDGDRRRRDLCAVTSPARRDRTKRRSHAAASRCVPTSGPRSSNAGSTAPRGKQSISTFLRKALSLSPAEIGLLQEVTARKARHAAAARTRSPHQRGADPPHRRRADRARDLDRGRRRIRRNSTRASCCAACPACSSPAKCSTGKRRPAATCCRRASRPAPRRDAARWSGCAPMTSASRVAAGPGAAAGRGKRHLD